MRKPSDPTVNSDQYWDSNYTKGDPIKVGDIVTLGTKIYEVVEAEKPGNCKGCDFLIDGTCCKKIKSCSCVAYKRNDKTWIAFKLIGNKHGAFKQKNKRKTT